MSDANPFTDEEREMILLPSFPPLEERSPHRVLEPSRPVKPFVTRRGFRSFPS